MAERRSRAVASIEALASLSFGVEAFTDLIDLGDQIINTLHCVLSELVDRQQALVKRVNLLIAGFEISLKFAVLGF